MAPGIISSMHQNLPRRLPRRRWLLRGIVASPILGLADAFAVEPGWIRVQRLRVGNGRHGVRFAQFTDVHFKGDSARLERVVELVNTSGAQFAVFTGDLIEEEAFLEPALAILRTLHVPLYGIPGNHDHWSRADFSRFREAFAATGGRWMQDEHLLAPGGIRIIGLDHPQVPQVPVDEAFRLVLVHYPAWADRLVAPAPGLPYDLILAGHTHGGQVRLPFVGPLVTPYESGRYDLGWFVTRAGPLYVNPGIGTFYLDVRFNCRPEVTVFDV
jgi:hypothetical protein